MLVGDPVSESQGGLEDVEERAFRPKVPKPPNRTALAANRTCVELLRSHHRPESMVREELGQEGPQPVLRRMWEQVRARIPCEFSGMERRHLVHLSVKRFDCKRIISLI